MYAGSPGGSDDKESTYKQKIQVQSLEKEMAWQPTPVFLPGESPWTKEPGGLQSMGLQRVRHG